MDTKTYVRKPFVVEAVEITEQNIRDCARYIGDIKEKDDGTLYILVDRRLVPNVFKVYTGFWMTKMGDNVRCYSRKIFKEQFVPETTDIKAWVEFMDGLEKDKVTMPDIDDIDEVDVGPEPEVGNRLGID